MIHSSLDRQKCGTHIITAEIFSGKTFHQSLRDLMLHTVNTSVYADATVGVGIGLEKNAVRLEIKQTTTSFSLAQRDPLNTFIQ